MGKRGPKPESDAVKRRKGNPGRRSLTDQDENRSKGALGADPDSEPSVGAGAASEAEGSAEKVSAIATLAAPEWVGEIGAPIWNALAPDLQRARILQKLDAFTFGRYCIGFGRWLRLQEKLDEQGETYFCKSDHGEYIKGNPAFNMADRLDRTLQMFEYKFGLNPADRQRLYAQRAAAALGGAGGADLFDNRPEGSGKEDDATTADDDKKPNRGPLGYLLLQ